MYGLLFADSLDGVGPVAGPDAVFDGGELDHRVLPVSVGQCTVIEGLGEAADGVPNALRAANDALQELLVCRQGEAAVRQRHLDVPSVDENLVKTRTLSSTTGASRGFPRLCRRHSHAVAERLKAVVLPLKLHWDLPGRVLGGDVRHALEVMSTDPLCGG